MHAVNPLQVVFGRNGGWGLFVGLSMLASILLLGPSDWSSLDLGAGVVGLFALVIKTGLAGVCGAFYAQVAGWTIEQIFANSFCVQTHGLSVRRRKTHLSFPSPLIRGPRRPPRQFC